jgi:5-methylcytosine-specific restriction enzyme A
MQIPPHCSLGLLASGPRGTSRHLGQHSPSMAQPREQTSFRHVHPRGNSNKKATPARPWAAWYDRVAWRRRAREHKRRNPLCVMCLARGLVVACEVADHVVPHKGDFQLFWSGELQSLCRRCHSGEKQQLEHRGYTRAIGADGWPSDTRHPANKLNC